MRLLFIITFIFLFLVYFALPVGNLVIPFYYFLLGLFFVLNLIFNFSFLRKKFAELFSLTSSKILLFLVYWIIFGISFSLVSGKFDFSGFINNFTGSIIFSVLLTYFTMILAIPAYITNKTLIKLVLIVFLGIYTLGILDLTGSYFHISMIQDLFRLLVNRIGLVLDIQRGAFTAFGCPRVASIFEEPSFFGYFITVTLPVLFSLSFSKYELFKNNLIDFGIKKMTFFLMLVNLVLTQSPIFFLIVVLQGILYFIYRLIGFNKKFAYILLSSILIITLSVLIVTYGLGNSLCFGLIKSDRIFLSRIFNAIVNINSLNSLIWVEPSLATRITNFFNQLFIFLQNPILGVGYGNLNSLMPEQVLNSSIPITNELFSYASEGRAGGGMSIFFKYMAETGIVGTFLLYSFFLNLIFSIKNKINYFSGIERDFLGGLQIFLVVVVCTSIYDSNPNSSILWLFIGIVQAMLMQAYSNSFKAGGND